jgi:hypothetical protein
MRKPQPIPGKKKASKRTNPFSAYRGKIIRSIEIRVLDPFGLSVNDTARLAGNRLERYGNKVHVTSKDFLIRNQLLFKKNDSLDALKLSETERVLRQAPYLTDARIYIKSIQPKHKKPSDNTIMEQTLQRRTRTQRLRR